MDLLRVAQVLDQLDESQAKRGTPARTIPGTQGSPKVVSQSKPLFAGLRGYQERPGSPPVAPSIPLNFPGGDPSTGLMEEAQGTAGLMIGAGPSSWVKPGVPSTPDQVIPGTPGTTELATKAGIAHLLTPDSAERMMNTRGYEGVKFAGKASEQPVFFNPVSVKMLSAGQVAELTPEERVNVVQLNQKDAAEEIGKYIRQKISASGQSAGEMLQLYRTLKSTRPEDEFFKSDSDRVLEKALQNALTEFLDLTGPVQAVKQENAKEAAKYKAELGNLEAGIQAAVQAVNRPSKERKADIRTAVEKFNKTYSGRGYHTKIKPEDYLKKF